MACCSKCQSRCSCSSRKPKRLSAEDEKLLLEAVEKSSALVESGTVSDPTEALAKVARELRLTPDFVKLVGYAYNAGATAEQRLRHRDILDKMATIPLANVDKAIRLLYDPDWPAKQAAPRANPADYWIPWDLVKGSAYVDRDRVKAESQLRKAAQHYRQTLRKPACASAPPREDPYKTARWCKGQEDLWRSICSVSSELSKSIAAGDCTVEQYKEAMGRYYGEAGRLAAETVVRAASLPDFWLKHFKRARWDVSRLGLSHPLIKGSAEIIDLASKVVRGRGCVQPKNGHRKRSNVLNLATAGVLAGQWGQMRRGGQVKLPLDTELIRDKVDSPKVRMNERRIRNQALLYNMMANDEVISQYQPEEVVAAYNEIAQLFPRASSQPAMMRALLRKRLSQGAAEPFESAQAAKVESHLWKRTAPVP